MTHIQTIIIDRVGPSLNKWYGGAHWSKRSGTKKRWRLLVLAAVHEAGTRTVQHYPVRLSVTCVFGKGLRSFDCTNVAATAKLVEDGLVACGVLRGDTPAYVRPVVLDSIKDSKRPTQTIIQIEEKIPL